MKAFLVTGGCGFIGSHLCRQLLKGGARVRVLDNLSTGKRDALPDGAELLMGDVRNGADLRDAISGVDGCFHLAAIASVERSLQEWAECQAVNLGGAVAVFQAARDAGNVPVVYASSAAVYGHGSALPLGETGPVTPLSPYGVDKYGCELHARVAAELFGLSSVGLRLFNVFGPGQDPASPYSGVISVFIRRALMGQPLLIHGDGTQIRDFVFVEDVVRHFLAAMDFASSGVANASVFNVCTGQPTTIAELASGVAAFVSPSPVMSQGPARSGDIRASLGDPQRARQVLGVTATVGLHQGLAATIAVMK